MTFPLGVVEASAERYHADDLGDTPTLSKSTMTILLEKSPAHARWAHPKLNPDFARKDEQKFDLGTVAHDVFLEGINRVAVVPFDDWRTKAAKDLRDDARAAGLTPLLAKDFERVEAMVVAVRSWLTLNHPTMFVAGKAEQTITWTDRGVACRARLDWFLDDLSEIHDLKSTSRSANPESWCRSTLFSIGADVQAAFYGRGVEAITGTRPDFKFAVCELEPPHAVSVIAMGPDVLTLAEKKIDYALDLWRRCLERDEWPAYPSSVAYADLPPWEESRWLAREERELGGVAA